MAILVVREAYIEQIEMALANALVDATDHHGRTIPIGTIEPAMRRAAAIGALAMASGHTIIPQSETVETVEGLPVIFLRRERR